MTGIRQGFFTTSSQIKKEEKKRNATSPNLTSSQYQPSSFSTIEGQQQATFKPSFKHPYTQLDTLLTAEKPKKKQQKQLPEVREFLTTKSEQQEQSDVLAMIIAQFSQEVENLKAKIEYATKLYNNGLALNQKIQARFEKKVQRLRDEGKDLRKQLTEHLEKSKKNQEQSQQQITTPVMMELEQNGHSLSFPPPPAKYQQVKHKKQCYLCGSAWHLYRQSRTFVEKQRIYWRTKTYKKQQAIMRQRQKIKNLRRMQNCFYCDSSGRMYKMKTSLLERFDIVPEDYVSLRSILLDDPNYLDKYNLSEGKPSTHRKVATGVKRFFNKYSRLFHQLNQIKQKLF